MPTSATHNATLVIAGAGTVGMSLAIDAGMRGLDVLVLEARREGEAPGAKCNTVAARTMETFRRFGIADAVRGAGLPDDYPTDTIYCTSIAGHELTRIPLPSRNERHQPGYIDSNWATPEPMVRVSQLFLEPILYRRMRAQPGVHVRHGVRVHGYQQDADGVHVHGEDDSGTAFVVRARYLAGCDGGRSSVRKAMDVRLTGDAELGRTRTTLIRAPGLKALFGNRRPAWMSWVANSRVRGNVVAIDGIETWLVHRSLFAGMKTFDELDFHRSIRDLIGRDIPYDVLSHEDWTGRRLVAERFRDRRVFVAGDAAHLWVPFAGYGMNAGIADAMSLSWVLSAVTRGWAPPAFLDAYEAERLPITDQVSRLAIGKVLENAAATGAGPAPNVLESDSPEGAQKRNELGARLHAINVPQFAPAGLNFGYFYDASPIIAYDGEPAPTYDMGSYTPSTVPGCRMPHFWLPDGRSVYDALSHEYTLVRFDRRVDISPLQRRAESRNLPLAVLDAPRPEVGAALRHALLIVRADQHVAWRGDAPPDNVDRLFDRLTGTDRRR